MTSGAWRLPPLALGAHDLQRLAPYRTQDGPIAKIAATASPATSSAPARRVCVNVNAANHNGQTGNPRGGCAGRERCSAFWARTSSGRAANAASAGHGSAPTNYADQHDDVERHHQSLGHAPCARLAEDHRERSHSGRLIPGQLVDVLAHQDRCAQQPVWDRCEPHLPGDAADRRV